MNYLEMVDIDWIESDESRKESDICLSNLTSYQVSLFTQYGLNLEYTKKENCANSVITLYKAGNTSSCPLVLQLIPQLLQLDV